GDDVHGGAQPAHCLPISSRIDGLDRIWTDRLEGAGHCIIRALVDPAHRSLPAKKSMSAFGCVNGDLGSMLCEQTICHDLPSPIYDLAARFFAAGGRTAASGLIQDGSVQPLSS